MPDWDLQQPQQIVDRRAIGEMDLGKITLHKLAGDPRASNREKMSVEIQSQEVPGAAFTDGTFPVNSQTGGGPRGMPPGSVYVYVFEAAK